MSQLAFGKRFERRQFLVSAGAALGAFGLTSFGRQRAHGRVEHPAGPRLVAAGDDLALPAGFGYAVLSTSASGGMPPAPDGMAAFAMPDGAVRLVRNHERADPASRATPLDAAAAYDASASGGTTTLTLAPDLRSVVAQHVSLSGTLQNCAGGTTPWGSWLSCEESTEGPEQDRRCPHGYVFEVPAGADDPVVAEPLTAMGRFLHEAAAVDPVTGIVYLTEDNGYDSGLYRFTPVEPGRLAAGGRLDMLAVDGEPGYDTAYAQRQGVVLPVAWVPIDEPDPSTAATDTSAVYNQGFGGGGARFKRAEGCCLVGSTLFVTVTEGGDAGLGQVWALDTAGDRLRLVVEAVTADQLFAPDNVTPLPGDAGVLIAEDNGNSGANRLHVVGPDDSLIAFAENIADTTEFAGPCFSPDGSTLFVNIYGDEANGTPGRTLAIWGPWESLA